MKFSHFFKRIFKKRSNEKSIMNEINKNFPEINKLEENVLNKLQKNVSYLLTNLEILKKMEDSVIRLTGETSDEPGDKRLFKLSKTLNMDPEHQKMAYTCYSRYNKSENRPQLRSELDRYLQQTYGFLFNLENKERLPEAYKRPLKNLVDYFTKSKSTGGLTLIDDKENIIKKLESLLDTKSHQIDNNLIPPEKK